MTDEQEQEIYKAMGWDLSELDSRESTNSITYEKLTENSQMAVNLFNILPDKIDGAAVGWYGKDFSSLEFFMTLLNVQDCVRVFEMLLLCVSEFSKHVERQRKKDSIRK